MRNTQVLCGAMMAAVLVGLLGAAARAEIKVGQVDVVAVVDQYERTKDAETDAKLAEADLKATAEPKIRKVEELRLQRDGFNKDSEEWKRLDEKALEAEVELRTWLAIERVKLMRKQRDVLLDIYREIQKAVGRAAKEKGLDLVLAKAFLTPGQIDVNEVQSLQDLKRHIVSTALLYPGEVVDVTQDVLDALNAGYKASKKAASGAVVPEG
ncbi:MAG TPA: OmpH family outer membrane protein [Phycisphaerae bacterium]|nr:OmpH family outer membrane protein [Phycisphaerae bacterium]